MRVQSNASHFSKQGAGEAPPSSGTTLSQEPRAFCSGASRWGAARSGWWPPIILMGPIVLLCKEPTHAASMVPLQ